MESIVVLVRRHEMGIQDREWYREEWEKKNQQGINKKTKKHNHKRSEQPREIKLDTYRTAKCQKCKKECYVHSPSKIGPEGFSFTCNFCGAPNRIYEKKFSAGCIILICIILLVILILALNILVYFKILPYIPQDLSFLQYVIFVH